MSDITVGVDLSTTRSNRGVVSIDWSGPTPIVTRYRGEHRTLDAIVDLSRLGTMAIDAPFGWPVGFVEFVQNPAAWHVHNTDPQYADYSPTLRLRETDRWVHDQTELNPMSVSMDKLGATAVICGDLRKRIERLGRKTDVFEVYPAASATRFGIKLRQADSWDQVRSKFSLQVPDEQEPLNQHECDATIAAITARCKDLNLCDDSPDAIESEGSIWLPRPDLEPSEL